MKPSVIKNILYASLFVLLTSCGEARMDEVAYMEAPPAPMMEAKNVMMDEAPPTEQPVGERKLIKNGELTFETNDVKKTKSEIEALCKQFNAYINNEYQNNFERRIRYNQVVRVPAAKFDSLMLRIESMAIAVESKNVNTQDVTAEFIDVEARLQTKKDLEARYREILKQAKTVQDIVSIEGQIANVRGEIESMEGRLKYLRNQVDFSTLSVSYFEVIGTDFGFANKFVQALGDGWDNLLEFLIAMVNLWPFILLASGLVFGIRAWRKRKRNQAAL